MAEVMVRLATSDDCGPVADTLGEALFEDPFNVWLLPDVERRRSKISAGMAQQFGIYHRRQGCWTTADHSGAALWAPPGTSKLGTTEQLRLLPGLGRVMGWRALPRILSGFSRLDKRHPDKPHWYLALLGVRPSRQGQGIGAALLQPVLERCDRDEVGAYLETANKDDLLFYQRHGFHTEAELDLDDTVHIWTMWRAPTT